MVFFGQQKQPKVGLVLSGGGAKGFAHIGVLKEIDKAGLQIDYIGGTSMGAIVGGLYAIGYSGKQIEKIILETDFISLLRDKLPRSTTPFVEKEYGEKTVITLPVVKGKIGLPKAVSKGQNMLNLLIELLSETETISDFSKLQIPFFCIATDVETGGQIVLEKGLMPISLRASGSFPTLLNPVEIGDKLLIDGGVANNFPIDIMREKGADIIIGVDVQGRLYQKEKLTSVVAILNQIVSYQMYNKRDLDKNEIEVYIHPEISKYNVVDFDKKGDILKEGDKVAQKYTAVFKEIATKQIKKKKRKKIERDIKKVTLSKITIHGIKNHTRAYILGKLNLKEGDSISRNDITKRIYSLSATKNYERIEYKLNKLSDTEAEIIFSLIELSKSPTIELGMHYDLLYESAILARYKQEGIFTNNDVFSFDAILGDRLRYNLNYFVDNGFYLSYGFRSRFNSFRANSKFNNIVSNSSRVNSINLKYTDFTNQLFVQTTFDRKFALGVGLEHKKLKITTETIADDMNQTIFDDSNYLNAFGYLKLDTYDENYFVKKGYFADLGFKWYFNSSDFNDDFRNFGQAKGSLGFATTFFNKLTFQNTNEAGFTIDNPTSNVFDFYVGGYNQNYINTFISLYGYEFAELADHSFLKTELLVRYQFLEKNYVSFTANFARLDDNVLKDANIFKEIKSGYALGYSLDSFLGPLEIKFSWSPDTKSSAVLFNLGYWF
jgi:NTE family protein